MPIPGKSVSKPSTVLDPFWQTSDHETVRLYHGDVLDVLRRMPAGSAHMAVTSPPYFSLRDYGTGSWVGGDEDCDHTIDTTSSLSRLKPKDGHNPVTGWTTRDASTSVSKTCRKCGARRIDRQLGSEQVPDCMGYARGVNCAEVDWENGCHVCRIVLVFREVRRVLRDDGTLWLNYGDTVLSKRQVSEVYTLRTDISDEEYKYAVSLISESEAMSSVQRADAQTEQEMPKVSEKYKKVQNTKMQEMSGKVQSIPEPTRTGDGEILLSGVRKVGKSNEGSSTEDSMPTVRENIQEVQCRDKRERAELLQQEVQSGMVPGRKSPTMVRWSKRKDVSRSQGVESPGSREGQRVLPALSLSGESASTSHLPVRKIPEEKVGRRQRPHVMQGVSQKTERKGNRSHIHPEKDSQSPSNGTRVGLTIHKSHIPREILHLFKPLYDYKPDNTACIPQRVSMALQADGWILRQDLIWHKPSCMPESTRSRCTKAHEYIFLFAKKSGYYFDAEAIKEKLKTDPESLRKRVLASQKAKVHEVKPDQVACIDRYGATTEAYAPTSSNKRSVWTVDDHRGLLEWLGQHNPELLDTYLKENDYKDSVWRVAAQGYEVAHFATFSPKLITPCILAGTSAYGCCAKCQAPWRRVTEQTALKRERPNNYVKRSGQEGTGNSCGNTVAGVSVKTLGWEPGCECYGKFVEEKGVRLGHGSYHTHEKDGVGYGLRQDGKGPASKPGEPTKEFKTTIRRYVSDLPLDQHPVVPCIVCDPFIGSATTAVVSIKHGRRCWGIDLSESYLLNNAIPRIEGCLLSRPGLAHLTGRENKRIELGRKL